MKPAIFNTRNHLEHGGSSVEYALLLMAVGLFVSIGVGAIQSTLADKLGGVAVALNGVGIPQTANQRGGGTVGSSDAPCEARINRRRTSAAGNSIPVLENCSSSFGSNNGNSHANDL